VTNESLLITTAAIMLAFGVFVTVLEHIRHPPATPVITFTGMVGVYLGLCAVVEHIRWLYLPCFILLLASAAIQVRTLRRHDDNDRTGGTA
jgi:xanthosine utilization system XapX-like protein